MNALQIQGNLNYLESALKNFIMSFLHTTVWLKSKPSVLNQFRVYLE